uniref:Putative ovule protein n=1 Tax=Solanum chacoense TaxID=4108 RepID=A0A0V0GW76_SOLCH
MHHDFSHSYIHKYIFLCIHPLYNSITSSDYWLTIPREKLRPLQSGPFTGSYCLLQQIINSYYQTCFKNGFLLCISLLRLKMKLAVNLSSSQLPPRSRCWSCCHITHVDILCSATMY